jgi:hypothetical protein
MNFLNRLERKFGKYAIRNLTKYIILTYVIGYVLYYISIYTPYNILGWLALNPAAILHGEVWRLVTWVLTPPTSLDIFTIIMLICYYQLGTILERVWGDFLYNVYIFFGLIMTIVGSFILYAIPEGRMMFTLVDMAGAWVISTFYVSLSIFLGFAMTFPEQQMLFMLFIPIKIKWLALVDVAYLIYEIVRSLSLGSWFTVVMILCSLASTIIFFFATRKYKRFHPGDRKRQKQFTKAAGYSQVKNGRTARHKCAICGRTELDDPSLEFRFCSKCNGNYEYCQNHLFTHEHVK